MVEAMDGPRDHGRHRTGQTGIDGRLQRRLDHGALQNRLSGIGDGLGTCHRRDLGQPSYEGPTGRVARGRCPLPRLGDTRGAATRVEHDAVGLHLSASQRLRLGATGLQLRAALGLGGRLPVGLRPGARHVVHAALQPPAQVAVLLFHGHDLPRQCLQPHRGGLRLLLPP